MPRRPPLHFSFSGASQGAAGRLSGLRLPFTASLCGAPADLCREAVRAGARREEERAAPHDAAWSPACVCHERLLRSSPGAVAVGEAKA